MNEMNKAAFFLDYYKIAKFEFFELNDDGISLNIDFKPSGRYISKDGQFILTFDFFVTHGEEKTTVINATLNAFFKFNEPIEFNEIPPYFYRNSIAIVFPYLRAFVSTLTSVANSKPIILPILNLSSLEQPLIENTILE